MSRKIRPPCIDAPTAGGKIEQIRSYLHQLVHQLNRLSDSGSAQGEGTAQMPEETSVLFTRLRPLIMRSADIINAYGEQLKGTFAPVSALGELRQAVDGVHMRSVTVETTGTLTVDCGLTDGFQLLFLSGWVRGSVARETVVVDVAGGLSQSGNLPLHGQEGGKFTLSVLSGDRLILISDGTFTHTVS